MNPYCPVTLQNLKCCFDHMLEIGSQVTHMSRLILMAPARVHAIRFIIYNKNAYLSAREWEGERAPDRMLGRSGAFLPFESGAE